MQLARVQVPSRLRQLVKVMWTGTSSDAANYNGNVDITSSVSGTVTMSVGGVGSFTADKIVSASTATLTLVIRPLLRQRVLLNSQVEPYL